MAKNLIITNGDSAAEILRAAFGGYDVLPWRDVLHEGPAPLTKDLHALSSIRAQYLSATYSVELKQTIGNFKDRDNLLRDWSKFESVVLWFEHDLYDQLQLIQILDFFASSQQNCDSIYIVQADEYLSEQNLEEIVHFDKLRKPLTSEQLNLARKAWFAFRQPTPESWVGLLKNDLNSLPFLKSAVQRMLEELPSCISGISRTEYQILHLLDCGVLQPEKLFSESQKMEEAAFMGDLFFSIKSQD